MPYARTILLTIAASFVVSTGPAKSAIEDIYRYDLGGTIEISSREALARLRSFLWRHWIEHKRGLIVTVVHSVDAGDSTVSYFVEPNAPGGAWRIVIDSRRNPQTDPDPTRQGIVIYDVKRIELVKDGFENRIEIRNDAVRRPDSYRLRLKTQEGNVFAEL
jgi:hypothetical protein